MDTPSSPEYGVHRSEGAQPVPENDGQHPDPERDVHRFSPVVPSDLREQGTTDTFTRGKKSPHDQPGPDPAAPELGEGTQAPGDVGAEVPGGEDTGRAALGDEPDLAVHDGRPSACSDVAGPGSPVQRHELDVPVLREWQETPEDWAQFDEDW